MKKLIAKKVKLSKKLAGLVIQKGKLQNETAEQSLPFYRKFPILESLLFEFLHHRTESNTNTKEF
jgi:hypothetical protein